MNPGKTLRIMMIILFAYMLLLTWFILKPPAVAPTVADIPTLEIKQGKYTIFNYTQNGWTNRLYVTEYYIEDRIIYYKPREHEGGYLEVTLENCLTVPGWIEDTDLLMDYGYWEYPEEGY